MYTSVIRKRAGFLMAGLYTYGEESHSSDRTRTASTGMSKTSLYGMMVGNDI